MIWRIWWVCYPSDNSSISFIKSSCTFFLNAKRWNCISIILKGRKFLRRYWSIGLQSPSDSGETCTRQLSVESIDRSLTTGIKGTTNYILAFGGVFWQSKFHRLDRGVGSRSLLTLSTVYAISSTPGCKYICLHAYLHLTNSKKITYNWIISLISVLFLYLSSFF